MHDAERIDWVRNLNCVVLLKDDFEKREYERIFNRELKES